jgi:dienelactone hydrolase
VPYGGEELENDVEVFHWDGVHLEFVKHGDPAEFYQATSCGRMLVGTLDIAGRKRTTKKWKGARAEVLTHGITPRSIESLTAWQERARAQIEHIIMAGNPRPLNARNGVVTPRIGSPTKPEKPYPIIGPFGIFDCPSQFDLSDPKAIPMDRDDRPRNRERTYSRTDVQFRFDIPNPYGTGAIRQKADAIITLPEGDPVNNLPEKRFPAVVVLAGHHGSAWSSLQPRDVWYWYGDGFARSGYAVLAINVGHRNDTVTNRFYVASDYAVAKDDYNCCNDFDGDGPHNHPHPAIAAPRMGHSDWSDDGERTWKVLQAFAWLRSLPYIDEKRIFVAGLSLGGSISVYSGALETGLAGVVAAGCSIDNGQNIAIGGDSDPHRCSFWDVADQREYTDTSDLFALVAPRTLVAQTGKYDSSFSSLRVGKRKVPAFFAVARQVARRASAAYASSPKSFVQYLHYDAHRLHFGVVATKQRESVRFVTQPIMIEPPPNDPWSTDWQYDVRIRDDRKTLLDYLK